MIKVGLITATATMNENHLKIDTLFVREINKVLKHLGKLSKIYTCRGIESENANIYLQEYARKNNVKWIKFA